ncbi:hypothetical protein D3C73_851820 [compost metagenome]
MLPLSKRIGKSSARDKAVAADPFTALDKRLQRIVIEAVIQQRGMVIPVISVIQCNGDQLLAAAGGGADEAAQRFFRISGLYSIRSLVQAQHFIFIQPLVVPWLIRVICRFHLGLHNLLEYRIMHSIGCKHSQVIGAGIMFFRIQSMGIGKMGVLQPQFLRLGIHQIHKTFFRSSDMLGNSCSGIVA